MLRTLAKQFVMRFLKVFGLEIRRVRPDAPAAMPIEDDILAPLDAPFRHALLSMYRGEPQLGVDGKLHPIKVLIPPSEGMWLYRFCVSVKPKSTLEIGLAYGYSTLYFLAAIARNGTGHHTAVDPYQHSQWHGIGLAHANAHAPTAGPDSSFRFIEDRSSRVATDLARSNSEFDLIFIDGSHLFDDVFVDFCLYAPLCAIGGHIVFDDMWMPSVRTVAAFVRANRADFLELPTVERNVSVFRRVGDDEREWDDFHKFAVARRIRG